jgi:acyl carrier protein
MEVTEKNEVFEKVKEIILDTLEVEEKEVIPEAKFIDDLGAHSLDIVEMIMCVEEIFRIEISDEDAEMLITVNDVVNYIVEGKSYLQGKKEKIELPQINFI